MARDFIKTSRDRAALASRSCSFFIFCVYSLVCLQKVDCFPTAITVIEILENHKRNLPVQIFTTNRSGP